MFVTLCHTLCSVCSQIYDINIVFVKVHLRPEHRVCDIAFVNLGNLLFTSLLYL